MDIWFSSEWGSLWTTLQPPIRSGIGLVRTCAPFTAKWHKNLLEDCLGVMRMRVQLSLPKVWCPVPFYLFCKAWLADFFITFKLRSRAPKITRWLTILIWILKFYHFESNLCPHESCKLHSNWQKKIHLLVPKFLGYGFLSHSLSNGSSNLELLNKLTTMSSLWLELGFVFIDSLSISCLGGMDL